MENWKNDRIGSCERGDNPTLMVKMKSGFAVIGDHQFLPGYCLLLGFPKSSSLNELPIDARKQYLIDMTLIGDAIIKVCNPLRINYSTLMNLDHFLHTHIEARYNWEMDEYKNKPGYFYPKDQRYGNEYEYSEEKYGILKQRLTEALTALIKETYTAENPIKNQM
jgi:diadenosine tetraphosphate (Ap4A) HIT family hydrolase